MQDIIQTPFSSGFLTFTLGIMFILTVYHLLLFFQHKEKLYLLYGSYTFFILMSQLGHAQNNFIFSVLNPINELRFFSELYTEVYYIIYFFFAFSFLDVKSEFPKWSKYCYFGIYFLIAFCVLKFAIYLFTGSYVVVVNGYFIFIIGITIISIVSYALFFKLKSRLKYYIIIGGIILSICSYTSLGIYIVLENSGRDMQSAFSILYLGFILENILFSLGLGQKQKNILDEHHESQERLILQLEENEELRKKVNEQLERDVKSLNIKAQDEKLTAVTMKLEKELALMKVTALRSQMNPHFIFNSLNSIKRYIIDNDKQNAVYYLNKFSKLIRKILAGSMENETSLSDEIETTELYVKIENIRFNNEINFTLKMDNDFNLETIKIPSLIIQPFIENAIWHGLSSKNEDKKLLLTIEIENATHLRICIEDNGIGRTRAKLIKQNKIHFKNSDGIKITEERLKNFSQTKIYDYKLDFIDLFDTKNNACGTQVILKIPLT